MLGQKMDADGPGLRTPKLVERAMADLSPGQRGALMRATFGDRLASELMRVGIEDPLQLVRAGSLPDARATLAKALNIPRGRLLGLLMRAEMLKIGPGRNGELGIRPVHDDQTAGEHYHRLDNHQEPHSDEHSHRIHVRVDPVQQLPGTPLVVVCKGKRHDVLEKVVPHIVTHPLPGFHQHHTARKIEPGAKERRCKYTGCA